MSAAKEIGTNANCGLKADGTPGRVRSSEVAVSRITVKLSAYHTGFSDEADFDAWIAYVDSHIDEAVGFDVDVNAFAFTGRASGFEDEVTGGTDEQQEAIREAVSHSLWDQACSNNFDQDPS
jgi:hypothetical protein